MKKSKHIMRKIVALIISLILIALCWRFLSDVAIYYSYTAKIRSIERFGNQTHYYTAFDIQSNWNDSLKKEYKKAVETKMVFVSNSDVGEYLYHSGYSKTGKIFRAMSIIGVLFALTILMLFSVKVFIALIKAWKASIRNLWRRHIRRY